MSPSVVGNSTTDRPNQSYQIPRLGFFSCSQKVGDFDGEEEGGRAADSNGFDCIGDSTVGGKALREIEGHGDNGLQVESLGQFRKESNVVSVVLIDGHKYWISHKGVRNMAVVLKKCSILVPMKIGNLLRGMVVL